MSDQRDANIRAVHDFVRWVMHSAPLQHPWGEENRVVPRARQMLGVLEALEETLASLRQEMFDSLDREGHRIEQLRQELEQARVNEGEAMLVLEGTEAKLEEAKRERLDENEALQVEAAKVLDLQADNEKLRAALREIRTNSAAFLDYKTHKPFRNMVLRIDKALAESGAEKT